MTYLVLALFLTAIIAGLLVYAIHTLQTHQSALRAMADEHTATRKQVKEVLRVASRTNSEATRLLQKQYVQQKDVDDILYWAKQERGELNG